MPLGTLPAAYFRKVRATGVRVVGALLAAGDGIVRVTDERLATLRGQLHLIRNEAPYPDPECILLPR